MLRRAPSAIPRPMRVIHTGTLLHSRHTHSLRYCRAATSFVPLQMPLRSFSEINLSDVMWWSVFCAFLNGYTFDFRLSAISGLCLNSYLDPSDFRCSHFLGTQDIEKNLTRKRRFRTSCTSLRLRFAKIWQASLDVSSSRLSSHSLVIKDKIGRLERSRCASGTHDRFFISLACVCFSRQTERVGETCRWSRVI